MGVCYYYMWYPMLWIGVYFCWYVTCRVTSALVSKIQISIRHICLILKLALYKCHIIIIIIIIYIIISENIRYLLWNRGAWRSLNNTHLTFLDPCIRCTNHLCDSSDLTDVNPHFIPSLLRKIQNVDLLWRHRYRSRPPAIVTSQWPIVPVWLLWTVI